MAEGGDTAFAALALLRCRKRLCGILAAIAEPRRHQLTRAISELDGLNDAGIKRVLEELARDEDAALTDAAARVMGPGFPDAPRAIRKWAARGALS